MSSAHPSLVATPRDLAGRHLGPLRAQGHVPAILYGPGVEPRLLSVATKDAEAISRSAGRSSLIDLACGDAAPVQVLVRETQRSPRTNRLVHIDFFAVNLKEKVQVDVPLQLVGESPAATLRLGQVLQTLSSLHIESMPSDLPSGIHVDVSGLKAVDDAVTVGQLTLPKGVALIHTDPDEIVVKIAPLRVGSASASEDEGGAGEATAPEETGGDA